MKHAGLGYSLVKDKPLLKIGNTKKGNAKGKNHYSYNKKNKFSSELHVRIS